MYMNMNKAFQVCFKKKGSCNGNTHTAYWLVIKCPGVRKSELSAVRYLFHKHTHTHHNTSKHKHTNTQNTPNTHTKKHLNTHRQIHTHKTCTFEKKHVYNLTKHYWGPSILSLSSPPLICFYIHLSRSCCCNFLHLDASFISADCRGRKYLTFSNSS